jgi:hypothetical protein
MITFELSGALDGVIGDSLSAVGEHTFLSAGVGTAAEAALIALAAEQALAPLATKVASGNPAKWRLSGSDGFTALGITTGHRA